MSYKYLNFSKFASETGQDKVEALRAGAAAAGVPMLAGQISGAGLLLGEMRDSMERNITIPGLGVDFGSADRQNVSRLQRHMSPGIQVGRHERSPIAAAFVPEQPSPGPVRERLSRTVPGRAWSRVADYKRRMDEWRFRALGMGEVLDRVKDFRGKRGVVLPQSVSPHVAAHEFGHAQFDKTRLGRLTTRALGHVGPGRGMLVGSAMAALGDPEGGVATAAPIVGAASTVPMLTHEVEASRRGLRAMRDLDFSPSQMRTARWRLGGALGTYAGLAGAAVAAPLAIRNYRRRRQEED